MQNNLFLYIAIGVGITIIIVVLIFAGILPGRRPASSDPVKLEFWGVEDDQQVWRPVFEAFKKQYSHIEVTYQRFDKTTYEDTLINRLAEGTGPDVFFLKNTWVTKHKDKISPLPKEFFQFSTIDFKNSFVDGAAENLISQDGTILGLPLFMDSLALLYNKDIFNAEGIAKPPANWDETTALAKRLTKLTPTGDIVRSGMTLGTAKNIENSFEITSAMMLQRSGTLTDPQTGELLSDSGGGEALTFYTSFADPTKQNFMWTERMANSFDAFAQESAVMTFGFAADLGRIRAKNAHLNIGITAFPQLADTRIPVTYGGYYFPVVSKLSTNPEEAWQFILFLTSREGASLYSNETGKPPARRDLIAKGPTVDELDVFYRQALIARNWLVPDERATKNLFTEAIRSITRGASNPSEAIGNLRQRLRLLIP